VVDFSNSDEDIENSFLVPFLWYRAKDKDLTEYETYECGIETRKVMIVGVDKIDEEKQITGLQVICLENVDLALMVERLDDSNEPSYFCPKVHFNKEDKVRTKPLQMIINSRGTYKVYLTYIGEDSSAIPIISFRVIMTFSHSKCVRVPVYLGEGDQEIVQLPKNGALPKNHWIKFRVKSGGSGPTFIRVFAQYYVKKHDLTVKIEIFKAKKKNRLNDTKESFSLVDDQENVEYFERYILADMDELTVIAETYPNHIIEPLAEFQMLEYRNDFFDGIEPSWLNFLPF
jgi:hypothetical protein